MISPINLTLPEDVLSEIEERITTRISAKTAKTGWPEWLSDKTAAGYSSCSVSTIKSWRRLGLPYRIVGGLVRIRRADLDVWLEAHPRGGPRLMGYDLWVQPEPPTN